MMANILDRVREAMRKNPEKQPTNEEIKRRLDAMVEEGTPLPGNVCKEPECGGRVAKAVVGLFHGRYIFDTPRCSRCGRDYLFAENAPRGSADKFWEMMHRPITT